MSPLPPLWLLIFEKFTNPPDSGLRDRSETYFGSLKPWYRELKLLHFTSPDMRCSCKRRHSPCSYILAWRNKTSFWRILDICLVYHSSKPTRERVQICTKFIKKRHKRQKKFSIRLELISISLYIIRENLWAVSIWEHFVLPYYIGAKKVFGLLFQPPPPFIDFIVNIDTAQITRIMKNCLMLQLIQNWLLKSISSKSKLKALARIASFINTEKSKEIDKRLL